jgi:GNAT superfamily N-acetyltransferase
LSTIRPWNAEDSVDELTTLLHLAYAPLGAMGLNYTAVDQSMCYVAEQDGKLVGTATVRGPYESSDCAYYTKPEVAIVNQVAVHPSFQSRGIARAILATCSSWARQHGYSKLALDTALPATHLIALYRKLGYTEVAQVQWSGKVYRSAVLSRHLSDA